MQAVFRFHGAEEIVVSNQLNGVMVEYYEGYLASEEHGLRGGLAHKRTDCVLALCGLEPGAPPSGADPNVYGQHRIPDMSLIRRSVLVLSKSNARAIASAMMGAAAEL